jgi:hypothetical protein
MNLHLPRNKLQLLRGVDATHEHREIALQDWRAQNENCADRKSPERNWPIFTLHQIIHGAVYRFYLADTLLSIDADTRNLHHTK